MDRTLRYAGQIPLVEQMMQAEQSAYVGLGAVINSVMGASSFVSDGFIVTPESGLTISVGPGTLTGNGTSGADPRGYGVLPATTLPSAKQYQTTAPTTLTLTAGATNTIYVTGATFVDDTDVVLPFYNSANPLQPFNGVNNQGTALPTTRKDVATVTVTTGLVPAGGFLLYTITLPAGATSVSPSEVITPPSSSLLPFKLPQLQPVLDLVGGTQGATVWTFANIIFQSFVGPLVPVNAANTQFTSSGSWPIAYPNSCLNAIAVDGNVGLINWNTFPSLSPTGFTIGCWTPQAPSGTIYPQARILTFGH